MRLERGIVTRDVTQVADAARAVEDAGLDGTFTFDGPHDPFLTALDALLATGRLRVSTQVAVAFARNPMTVAQTAWDLSARSGGRFALGLGSQIRAHVTRRYSMPWGAPVDRMREFVTAVRAIWTAWQDGTELDVRGAHYEHTLMPPFFRPEPLPHDRPAILLAGVGPAMVEVAGQVADGWVVHPFHSPGFVRDVSGPALARGAVGASRDRADLEVVAQTIVTVGRDAADIAAARQQAKAQLGFYASTPAYRPVLEHHGLGDLQPRARALTRERAWDRLSALVPDELVDLVAVGGTPSEVALGLQARNHGWADTTALVLYGSPALLPELVAAVRAVPDPPTWPSDDPPR